MLTALVVAFWATTATAVSSVAAPSTAAATAVSWSTPFAVSQIGGQSLNAISCRSRDECVALDGPGRVVRFNPAKPASHSRAMLDLGGYPAGLSCPTSSECVALYDDGLEYTFDPSTLKHSRPVEVDTHATNAGGGVGLSLDCPSASLCVVVDVSGNIVTFNPISTAATLASTAAYPTAPGGLVSVSCYASGSECTAIGWTQELTFAPSDPGAVTAGTVSAKDSLTTVDCPTASECNATDGNGGVIEFDQRSPASSTVIKLDRSEDNAAAGYVCESATLCTYLDQGGREISYDPQTNRVAKAAMIESYQPTALTCTSTTACVATDFDGAFADFNPVKPTEPRRSTIDPGTELGLISCPAADECVAGSGDQAGSGSPDNIIRFDPRTRHAGPSHQLFRASGVFLTGLDCVTTTLCTAVVGFGEQTFNPLRFKAIPNTPFGREIEPDGNPLVDVSCPTVRECLAVDDENVGIVYRPSPFTFIRRQVGLYGFSNPVAVSCPAANECVYVDNDGEMTAVRPLTDKLIHERTIDPLVGLDAPSGDSDNELDEIKCPSTTLCVAIDSLGNVVRFNPLAKQGSTLWKLDDPNPLNDLACPTTRLCVAVDAARRVVVGDPVTAVWQIVPVPSRAALPAQASLLAVACPNRHECVVTDTLGEALVLTIH